MGLAKSLLFVFITFFLFSVTASASNDIWTDVPGNAFQLQKNAVYQIKARSLTANVTKLKNVMDAAPAENTSAPVSYIDLPLPDGEMHTFVIEESPIMSSDLTVKYPAFKTYRVHSKDKSALSGRLDLLPTGFHAYLMTDKGVVFIDPDSASTTRYRSYYKNENLADSARQFSCGVKSNTPARALKISAVYAQHKSAARNSNQLRTYRLAVAATLEYGNAVAAGKVINTPAEFTSNALASITTAINRINFIFERDFAVRLELVANNNLLISNDTNDFSNYNSEALLLESKSYIDSRIGVGNYDIGHVFSTGAGGLATLGTVCNDTFKAEGVTGIANPVGDAFYIDYVAHELGHQFSADHTFNGITLDCGGNNRNASTAYEPGSGSTIMAYAGICGTENIQLLATSPTAGGASDDTFHAGSIDEVANFIRNGSGSNCATLSTNGNTAPMVNAGADYTIPEQTPFELTGSATDINSDVLTYQWDEMDIGSLTNAITFGTDLGDNPLFRSFAPSSNPVRTLPRIETIVSGANNKAERLPSTDRKLNFRLTVRDQNRGVFDDDVQLTVSTNSGPFRVISAASSMTLDVLQPQVLEWDAACTNNAPVSCANVDILLSTDGGASFPQILLAATANDGEETINFPAINSTAAIIKIACSDNIFFDVNDGLLILQQGSGSVLKSTGTGALGNNCVVAGSNNTAGVEKVSGGGGGGGMINLWALALLLLVPGLFRRLNAV